MKPGLDSRLGSCGCSSQALPGDGRSLDSSLSKYLTVDEPDARAGRCPAANLSCASEPPGSIPGRWYEICIICRRWFVPDLRPRARDCPPVSYSVRGEISDEAI